MTSAQGLQDLETRICHLKELHQRNVTIRVIAPLTNENLKAAQQMCEYCNIRHAAINYITTTIIDEEHLFQFKTLQIEVSLNPPIDLKAQFTQVILNILERHDYCSVIYGIMPMPRL